jgi:hypothetical protein
MYVQHEPENRVCQRIGSRETDFAISIKSAEDPTSFTPVGNEADRMLTWMTTSLPEHLVCLEEDGGGNGEAERLGGLQVDDEVDLCRLLDRQVGGLGTLQDLVHVGGDLLRPPLLVCGITHEGIVNLWCAESLIR